MDKRLRNELRTAGRAARQIAEYTAFGRRAGGEMAESERYQGHEAPRTDDAVRMIAAQNVLGAESYSRAAYVDAFLAGYSERFTA